MYDVDDDDDWGDDDDGAMMMIGAVMILFATFLYHSEPVLYLLLGR